MRDPGNEVGKKRAFLLFRDSKVISSSLFQTFMKVVHFLNPNLYSKDDFPLGLLKCQLLISNLI